ncbi:AMP-binding protein [Nitrospira moscoviensis]|uniref:AMP-dependent synthetase and ligase n=1 Tax=Nitrospira moscoviensis TaxID=42253 RepID=A0A0K2GDX8_NITMO|nr:AMP-binding protein [Nitrospira moscoviensis]ALA59153.1 AMP-dependent synthetase and ligase [Nitrospira moscoviensis]
MDPGFHGETLQDLIRSLVAYEQRPAVVAFDRKGSRTWSFRDLLDAATRLAAGLAAEGVARGDHAILCAPASPEWIVACFALIEAGAVPVPVDTQAGEEELRHILRDSDACRIFTVTSLAERLTKAVTRPACGLILLDADEGEERSIRRYPIAAGGRFPAVDRDDPAVLFYTSGTTGLPKGVPLTHGNITSNLRALLNEHLLSADDRLLLPLPLHHVYPFAVGLLTPLASGVPVVLPHSLVGPQILRSLTEGQVTVVVAVPRFYTALVTAIETRMQRSGRLVNGLFRLARALSTALRRRFGWRVGRRLFAPLHRRFAPRLRMVASGGAALDPDVAWKLEGLGWQVASGYGLTETSPILTFNLPGARQFASAGVPLPNIDLRIAKSDPASPHGEVQAKGPSVFAGYRHLPDQTRDAFTEDGYFKTGDLGSLKDGALYLSGRVSSMIVLPGGENINPESVEAVLEHSESIREAGVLEEHHRLVALVVPEASATRGGEWELEPLIRREVQRLSATLPSHRRLGDYAITLEPLPRTRLGKIRRHKLRELYTQVKRQGGVVRQKGPMPVEQMAPEDRQVLEQPEGQRVWDWLPRRFPDARLTPDTHLHLDLGVDSLEWLSLTLELREQTGLDLSDEAIGRIETVRDLLREAVEAREAAGAGEDLLDRLRRPLELLDERQRRWLAPPGAMQRTFGAALLSLARLVMTRAFGLTMQGVQHVPRTGPCVLVPNHTSVLDPLALIAALPRPVLDHTYWSGWTGIMFRNAVMRFVSRATRVVPIEQGRSALTSLAFGAAILDGGHPLVWFAEGGRSPDGRLKPFQPGVGLLLQARPMPAVPVWIEGGYEALPPGSRRPRFRPLRLRFGPPVAPPALERQGTGRRPHDRITDALHAHVAALASRSGSIDAPD